MTSNWLSGIDVSWLDCVTDDVVNVISANCPRLKMLLANGCANVRGSDLSHQSLVYLDFGQNLTGTPLMMQSLKVLEVIMVVVVVDAVIVSAVIVVIVDISIVSCRCHGIHRHLHSSDNHCIFCCGFWCRC